MKLSLELIFLLLALLIFIVSYFWVPLIFFQQDEILGFGLFIKEGAKIIYSGLGETKIQHFIPLTMSLSYGIFSLLGLKYWTYNLVALLFHLLNGWLVYLIAGALFKKKISAVFAILLFFSSNVAAQLIMWPVINLNSLSLTFSLLAWLAVIKRKFFWLPILFLSAVFSVEYSAGLILFIPFAVLLGKKAGLKQKIINTVPFGVAVFAYILFRFLPIISGGQGALVSTGEGGENFVIRIFNLVTRYFGQLFLGQDVLLTISKGTQKIFGLSGLGTAYAETTIYPLTSSLAGVAMVIVSFFVYRKIAKDREVSRNFLVCLSFIFFSALPFLLVPGGAGLSSVIASRYMYFGLAGMGLVIAFIYDLVLRSTLSINKKYIEGLLLLIIAFGTIANFTRAKKLYDQGVTRINILNKIRNAYPTLPMRAVFFIPSDTSYYGLPPEEKILPFQSGLGQTLLVYYSEKERFPDEFYPGNYLWEISSQGYLEAEGRGFGYFRNLELLKKAVEGYNIPPDAIIAFSWSGGTEQLEDITEKIRKEVTK